MKDLDQVLVEKRRAFRDEMPQHAVPDVDRATRFILENLYDAALNVERVRRECSIRSNQFPRRFRRCHGCTPLAYIRRKRVEAAKRLLEHGVDDMYLVALSVGYERYRTFARNFKKVTGDCPTQYQRAQQ